MASRAAKEIPPPGTPASRQKAYRQRRKAKGLDPYSARELAEQATRKAIEEAKYENKVPAAVIGEWFAPSMDMETALKYVRENVVPSQPQVAEKYIEQIAALCRRHNFHLNRYTLAPDGIEQARIYRALTWRQNGGKFWGMSWTFAQLQSAKGFTLGSGSAADADGRVRNDYRRWRWDRGRNTVGFGITLIFVARQNPWSRMGRKRDEINSNCTYIVKIEALTSNNGVCPSLPIFFVPVTVLLGPDFDVLFDILTPPAPRARRFASGHLWLTPARGPYTGNATKCNRRYSRRPNSNRCHGEK